MTSIDAFLRLIGRAMPWIAPVTRSTSVSSSDRSRQPRLTSPAQSVLLPEPGGAGRIAARPPFSITAAWTIRNWCACAAMHQFKPHSSIGYAWPAGSGRNDGRSSK